MTIAPLHARSSQCLNPGGTLRGGPGLNWIVLFVSGLVCLATITGSIQGAGLEVVVPDRTEPVDFEREILPVFRKNCLACHGSRKPKGGLILETPQTIAKGGDGGEVLESGKGQESFLFQVAAHLEEDSIMPPKGNKVKAQNMTPEELGLLKLWIDQGAKGEVRGSVSVEWQPMPPSLNAIHAVAVSQDGQWAACGRANHIDLYHVPSKRLVAELTDPALVEKGPYQKPGAAHLDMVQALTFDPSGERLASAGYREVKIWRLIRPEPKHAPAADQLDAGKVRLVESSPDGKWLVTVGDKPGIFVWAMADGKQHRVLEGATNLVSSISIAPDSSKLVAASGSSSLLIWDLAEGTLLGKVEVPAEIKAVAWTGFSDTVAAGMVDHSIHTWKLGSSTEEPMTQTAAFKGHSGPVTSLALVMPAGDQLLSGSSDGSVRLWNIKEAKEIRSMDHGGPVAAVAVRPDGQRFASAGLNKVAKLWNAGDGKMLADLKGDRYKIEAVAAMERTKTVASGDVAYRKSELGNSEKEHKSQTERVDKATKAFEPAEKAFAEKQKAFDEAGKVKNGEETKLAKLHEDVKRVTEAFAAAQKVSQEAQDAAKSAAETAAQAQVALVEAGQSYQQSQNFLAEARGLEERARNAASMSGLKDDKRKEAERRAADAKTVADKAKIFEEDASAEVIALEKQVADSKAQTTQAIELVSTKAFAAGQSKVDYDQVTKDIDQRLKNSTNAIAEAGKKLVASEKELKKAEQDKSKADTELKLAKKSEEQAAKDVEAARKDLSATEEAEKVVAKQLEGARQTANQAEVPLLTLAFSPDNLLLAIGTDSGQVQTWSADTGAAFDVHKIGDQPVVDLAFARDGQLATASTGQASLLHASEGQWRLERQQGTGGADSPLVDRVNALAFNPDGSLLATGGGEPSRNGEIKIWRLEDGAILQDLPEIHSDTVVSLEFSPDGILLASGGTDKFARVLDVKSGKLIKSFEGHTHHVMGVSWKGDGRTLASSGADNVVKIWDYVKGERKKNVQGFDKEVTSIQFVGVTDQVLVTAGDNKVKLIKEDGKDVRSFPGVNDFQHAAAITPDGAVVVAGGEGSVLRVWDGQSGKEIAKFEAP